MPYHLYAPFQSQSFRSQLLNQISRAPSPRQAVNCSSGGGARDDLVGCNTERKKSVTMTETPCSLSPSSDEATARRRAASNLSRPHSQHSRAGNVNEIYTYIY